LIDFIRPLDPDILGLVEVDAGSYRSGKKNQASQIASALGHYHAYRSKYAAHSWYNRFPVLNKQGNAFLARDTIHNERFHYFSRGMKRLVIELELENVVVYLVHLALTFRTRQTQLGDLYSLIKETTKPHIVAGDFNALWGRTELMLFCAATGLVNPDEVGIPTFPSWAPKRQLDFILHSPDIRVTNFWVPQATFSDHLPLLLDFEI
jgi:endonuclease/exonuclease/phosphatase family metal-dependent hydrolase